MRDSDEQTASAEPTVGTQAATTPRPPSKTHRKAGRQAIDNILGAASPAVPEAPNAFPLVASPAETMLARGTHAEYHAVLPPEIGAADAHDSYHWCVEWTPGQKVPGSESTAASYTRTWNDVGVFDVVCRIDGHGEARFHHEILPIEDLARRSLARVGVTPMEEARLRAKTALDIANLTFQNGPSALGASILSDTPNPVASVRRPTEKHASYRVDGLPHDTVREHLHWYIASVDQSLMAFLNYEGLPRVPFEGGLAFYLSAGDTAAFPLWDPSTYHITCVEAATATAPHLGGTERRRIATFTQIVGSEAQVEAVEKLQKQVQRDDELMKRVPPGQGRAIRAMYVGANDGVRVALRLYLGADTKNPGHAVLIDMTEGVSRSSFEGKTETDALSVFENGNDYPPGLIELEVPGPDGANTTRSMKTFGKSKLARTSSDFALAGEGLATGATVAGMAGLSTPAGWLFLLAAAPFAIASALDIEDQLDKDEPNWRTVSIDMLQIAGAFLGTSIQIANMRGIAMGGKEFMIIGRLGAKFGPTVLVQTDYIHQWLQVRDSSLPNDEKRMALAMMLYAQMKLGIAIALESRAASLGTATNADSKAWSTVATVSQVLPSPAAMYFRPHEESKLGSGEGDESMADAGASDVGPHGVVCSGSAITECGRAPDMKAFQYHLAGKPRSQRRQWYALCERLDIMALDHFGYRQETVPSTYGGLHVGGQALAGQRAYNLGDGETPWWALMMPNLYTIACIELDDAGHPLQGAVPYFVQRVVPIAGG